jgi:hypothetical protein
MGTDQKDYERLEAELHTEPYRALIQLLGRIKLVLRRFQTWADVIALMRDESATTEAKDAVLRAIFTAHKKDGDHRWRTVLLVLFWPALKAICHRNRRWDTDANLLWQNAFWAFHETIFRFDIDRRFTHLATKICCDTKKRLYRMYERDWDWQKRKIVSSEQKLSDLVGGEESLDLTAVDLLDEKAKEFQTYERYQERGVISEAEFFLAVGTRVYRTSLAEYARNRDLSYETVKKMNQRLDAKIRQREKKS